MSASPTDLLPAPSTVVPSPPAQAGRAVDTKTLAEIVGVGTALLTGSYQLDVRTGEWWCSDEVYLMHGLAPGSTELGIAELTSRKHPDDRRRIIKEAVTALREGRSFTCAHRIVDARGRTRTIAITGSGRTDRRGRLTRVTGQFVDLTAVQREVVDREAQRATTLAMASGARVEQAKGALMAIDQLSDRDAAAFLGRQAGRLGVESRDVAQHVLAFLQADPVGSREPGAIAARLDAMDASTAPRPHSAQLARRARK
jgi:hypothetical protein